MDKNFKLNEETQTVSELWESIAKISQHVVNDLAKAGEYDINIRGRQLYSLEVLANNIKAAHLVMNRLSEGKQIRIKDLFRGGKHPTPLALGMVGTIISKTEYGYNVQFDGFQHEVMFCELEFI